MASLFVVGVILSKLCFFKFSDKLTFHSFALSFQLRNSCNNANVLIHRYKITVMGGSYYVTDVRILKAALTVNFFQLFLLLEQYKNWKSLKNIFWKICPRKNLDLVFVLGMACICTHQMTRYYGITKLSDNFSFIWKRP